MTEIERRQIIGREHRQPELALLDQRKRCFDRWLVRPRHWSRWIIDLPQQIGDFFQRRGLGEPDCVLAAVIEPAVFDQADRRTDHRNQGFGRAAAVTAVAAAGAKPLDIFGPVTPLAAARHRDRTQQPAADIGVKRVQLDPEPIGGIARAEQGYCIA